MATGVAGSGITALLATVVWLNWYGGRRASRGVRRQIDRTLRTALPYESVPTRPSDVGRRLLLDEVRAELDRRYPDPVLVTGEAGSGKTTFLTQVAGAAAQSGLIPVVVNVSGRDIRESVQELIRHTFVRSMDSFLMSADHGDRLWRRFTRTGRVVIFIDSLDESALVSDEVARARDLSAFFASLSAIAPTYVTVRPSTVPGSVDAVRFDLPPLSAESLAVTIVRRVPRTVQKELVLTALNTVEAGRVPFFSTVLGDVVARDQEVPALSDKLLDARYELLSRYVLPVSASVRSAAGSVALQHILSGGKRSGQPLTISDATTFSVLIALGHLSPVGLAGAGTSFRFAHSILEAFYASYRTSETADDLDHLAVHSPVPDEIGEVILWSHLRDGGTRWPEWMLEHLPDLPFGVSMMVRLWDIADGIPDPALVESVGRSLSLLDILRRRQVVAALAEVRDPWAVRLLVLALSDSDYAIRWEAAEVLAARVDDQAIREWFSEELLRWSGTTGFARSLLMQERLLWVAPAHSTSRSTPWSASELWAHVQTNSKSKVPGSLGSESSLAQGIKMAVLASRPVSLDLVREMMSEAQFWFARLELVQAVALMPAPDREHLRDVVRMGSHDPNPFVRAAARLTIRAQHGRDWRPWVWTNERKTLEDGASRLSPVALLLLADVLTVLNLYLAGDQSARDAAGAQPGLPPCVVTSSARSRLDALGCEEGCTFGLCPYPLSGDFWSRGRFPRAFSQRVGEAVNRVGAPPWYHGSADSYVQFWNSPRTR